MFHSIVQVFRLGVVLQPSSSEALCHLGNGQFSQYEASEEERWLKDAELSFRASIAMEGSAISSTLIPDKLKEQEWWKKRNATEEAVASPAGSGATKTAPAVGKQPANIKQPAGKPVQPAGRARGGPPTSRTQPGAGRGSTGAPKVGSAGAKTTGVDARRGGAKVASSKPGPVQKPCPRVSSGKTVATLGDIKTGGGGGRGNVASKSKEPRSSSPAGKGKDDKASGGGSSPKQDTTTSPSQAQDDKSVTNKPSYLSRLGLARTLAKTQDPKKQQESHKLYKDVMKMSPDFHDAYIELGEILAKTNPEGAVEVYARFPFDEPPTFDDAYLHGEIIRLLMKSGSYDNPRLSASMIAMGKALGIGVLDKQVTILEGKFKYHILKIVYAGVHGKAVDDTELAAFFKFKCWI